jgi:hypothetical protein
MLNSVAVFGLDYVYHPNFGGFDLLDVRQEGTLGILFLGKGNCREWLLKSRERNRANRLQRNFFCELAIYFAESKKSVPLVDGIFKIWDLYESFRGSYLGTFDA